MTLVWFPQQLMHMWSRKLQLPAHDLRVNERTYIFRRETITSHATQLKLPFSRTRAGPHAETQQHRERNHLADGSEAAKEDLGQNWTQRVSRPWGPHPGPAGNNKNLISSSFPPSPVPYCCLSALHLSALWALNFWMWIFPSVIPFTYHLPFVCCYHTVF